MYLGISVIKDGISIAELNTSRDTLLKSSGRARYYLDTTPFNGGLYTIGAGLFRAKMPNYSALIIIRRNSSSKVVIPRKAVL